MMDNDRLDLSPLDPAADPVRWQVLAAHIHERARPELARRSALAAGGAPGNDLLGILGYWARPLLAAASLVGVLSAGALALTHPAETFGGVLAALQLNAPVSAWLESGGPITMDDFMVALEGGSR
jgi:hypothetical protein